MGLSPRACPLSPVLPGASAELGPWAQTRLYNLGHWGLEEASPSGSSRGRGGGALPILSTSAALGSGHPEVGPQELGAWKGGVPVSVPCSHVGTCPRPAVLGCLGRVGSRREQGHAVASGSLSLLPGDAARRHLILHGRLQSREDLLLVHLPGSVACGAAREGLCSRFQSGLNAGAGPSSLAQGSGRSGREQPASWSTGACWAKEASADEKWPLVTSATVFMSSGCWTVPD